ncbi:hypothetical protein HMPREF0083_05963 [Aneurinibacillus aneurinilyticus ATCC 12856]|uniref:Uncharacterized protein n=1 Tax=Aneurinibacillus aneurinilyticus ATCC 12856 TaxID=649747 RepID=U1WR19_ANEAE|nr:hypothetical protein HMPREF0083_05963 [Aneurinibacillus aneurinilyticus ATCC 12856]
MNIGLGVFWSIPTIISLIVGILLLRNTKKKLKIFGFISILLSIFLLINVILLFMDTFEV